VAVGLKNSPEHVYATFGATVLIANTFSTFLIFEPAQSGRGALQYITGAAYRTATVDITSPAIPRLMNA
jgi:hypothetical protein